MSDLLGELGAEFVMCDEDSLRLERGMELLDMIFAVDGGGGVAVFDSWLAMLTTPLFDVRIGFCMFCEIMIEEMAAAIASVNRG